MTRLIDADAFIEEAQKRIDMQDLFLPVHIKEFVIDEMPTIYAVPVIRCRDCVEFLRWDDEFGECYDGLADGAMVRADGYCYVAERKKDDIQK